MISRLIPLFVISTSLVLAACGDNGGLISNRGHLELGITDAPVDSAEAVVIHVISATLHGPDGDTTVDVLDPVSGEAGRSIDLLQLQGGKWTGLFDETVTAGHYSWIRLELDLDQSYIQIAGAQHVLRCTSCENAGYRINRSFDVKPGGATLALMLDFDVRKSITDPNGASPDYILRPTVRLIEVAASGAISGTVDATLISSLGGGDCSVYVYDGHDAPVDDVYIPINTAIPDTQNNPVTTAKVSSDGSNTYTAAFLPTGDYTIALTCDAANDSAASDDALTFSNAQNVTVVAGDTTSANFVAPVPPPVVAP